MVKFESPIDKLKRLDVSLTALEDEIKTSAPATPFLWQKAADRIGGVLESVRPGGRSVVAHRDELRVRLAAARAAIESAARSITAAKSAAAATVTKPVPMPAPPAPQLRGFARAEAAIRKELAKANGGRS
jgi:hypothetical protein